MVRENLLPVHKLCLTLYHKAESLYQARLSAEKEQAATLVKQSAPVAEKLGVNTSYVSNTLDKVMLGLILSIIPQQINAASKDSTFEDSGVDIYARTSTAQGKSRSVRKRFEALRVWYAP